FVFTTHQPWQGGKYAVQSNQVFRGRERNGRVVLTGRHVQHEVGARVELQVHLLAPVGLKPVGVRQVQSAVHLPADVFVTQDRVRRWLAAGLRRREPDHGSEVVGERPGLLLPNDVNRAAAL